MEDYNLSLLKTPAENPTLITTLNAIYFRFLGRMSLRQNGMKDKINKLGLQACQSTIAKNLKKLKTTRN